VVQHFAADDTWYIIQYTFGAQDSITIEVDVQPLSISNMVGTDGVCSLYIREDDALAATQPTPQATTTISPTTGSVPATVAAWSTGTQVVTTVAQPVWDHLNFQVGKYRHTIC